jgi:hypothetical protein
MTAQLVEQAIKDLAPKMTLSTSQVLSKAVVEKKIVTVTSSVVPLQSTINM